MCSFIGHVFIYEYRKVISDLFYRLSYSHSPHFSCFLLPNPFYYFLLLCVSINILENIWTLPILAWLILLSTIISNFIVLKENDISSFCFLVKLLSIMHIYHIFLYSLIHWRHPLWFHNLAVLNWAAININGETTL